MRTSLESANVRADGEGPRPSSGVRAPGKVTAVEQSFAASGDGAGVAAGVAPGGRAARLRAGDWAADSSFLAAMGGDGAAGVEAGGPAPGSRQHAQGDTIDNSHQAVAAVGADRAAAARDPVLLYLYVHSTSVAAAVAGMLRDFEDE